MRIERLVYNLALPVASAWARIAAVFDEKIAEGLSARRGLRKRWTEKAGFIDHEKPLLWFHVSSVGEFLQARPVIDGLRRRHGEGIQIALTFFSPSGMNYYSKFDRSDKNPSVLFVDYLPVDTSANARFCISNLRPDAIVYVKFDLWPNLIMEAHGAAVPQVLVSCTLSPGSIRLRLPAASFYGELYSRLDAIAAISDKDAERFRRGMKDGTKVIVAGDTRYDQVCERIDSSEVPAAGGLLPAGRDTLIAGSTWPPDERIVVPAFASLARDHPGLSLVLAPHEPTSPRLEEIEKLLESNGLEHVRLSGLGGDSPGARAVIADGVGYLAELYRAGTIAYVGGSRTTGVHNVMEPAVLGLPVFFGPRIDNSLEALELVEHGAGRVVDTSDELADAVSRLLNDRDLLARTGETGRRLIREGCGAASRCIDLVERLAGMKEG